MAFFVSNDKKCDNLIDLDNDSGFVSQIQESNSTSNDVDKENIAYFAGVPADYLYEETLLEQPTVSDETNAINQGNHKRDESEYSHLFFLNDFNCTSEDFIHFKEKETQNSSLNSTTTTNTSFREHPSCSTSEEPLQSVAQSSLAQSTQAACSPEIFSDEETVASISDLKEESSCKLENNIIDSSVHENDCTLLKRVSASLRGVHPPTSLTVVRLTVDEILSKIKANVDLFAEAKPEGERTCKSLLFSSTEERCLSKQWPEILQERCHGLQ